MACEQQRKIAQIRNGITSLASLPHKWCEYINWTRKINQTVSQRQKNSIKNVYLVFSFGWKRLQNFVNIFFHIIDGLKLILQY